MTDRTRSTDPGRSKDILSAAAVLALAVCSANGAVASEPRVPASHDSGGFTVGLAFDASESAAARLHPGTTRQRTSRAALAFRDELSHEAGRFRDRSPWALAPDALVEDEAYREGRERAARRALCDAAAAALEALVVTPSMERRASVGPPSRTASGFRLDGTPSWTLRKSTSRSRMRLDVPLIGGVRVRASKDLSAGRGSGRISGSFSVDPWDSSARVALTLSF